jgi:hypothetical protein
MQVKEKLEVEKLLESAKYKITDLEFTLKSAKMEKELAAQMEKEYECAKIDLANALKSNLELNTSLKSTQNANSGLTNEVIPFF